MAAPRVPEDTRRFEPQLYPGGAIDALDAGTYDDFSNLPPQERSRIVDKSGKSIPETSETPDSNGRHILAALDFHREEHVSVNHPLACQDIDKQTDFDFGIQNVVKEAKSLAVAGDTVILFNVVARSM